MVFFDTFVHSLIIGKEAESRAALSSLKLNKKRREELALL